jgi:hypothetical protein
MNSHLPRGGDAGLRPGIIGDEKQRTITYTIAKRSLRISKNKLLSIGNA